MNDNIIKQPLLPNAIQFHTRQNDGMAEVMRITRDGIWVNSDMQVDEAAKAVLDALGYQVNVLVQKAVEDEREACALICDGISDYYETRTDLNQTQKQVGQLAAEVCGVRIRERQ